MQRGDAPWSEERLLRHAPGLASGPFEPSPTRILIVDDEADIRSSLQLILEEEISPVEVYAAEDGQKAIEVLRVRKVDVIITDQRMPNVTGLELLDESLELRPDAFRILITAAADVALATQAINKGKVDRFFPKPVDPAELVEAIHDLMSMKRKMHRRGHYIQ